MTERLARHLGLIEPFHDRAGKLQDLRHVLAHGQLPGIELAPLAPHGDKRQKGQAAGTIEREHVDAIADPAALHQEHAALAAEPGAGE